MPAPVTLKMRICLVSLLAILSVVLCSGTCLALNLGRLKVHILNGDYKAAITEGEKLLAASEAASHSDELYYLMGISYLKDGNFLRASDIFEIILNEFKDSSFADKAKMGLADTYFLQGDFSQARSRYEQLLSNGPRGELTAALYYRLSQVALKEGDTTAAESYLGKLRNDYPLNPELQQSIEICSLPPAGSELYYSVQVGSFVNAGNAANLSRKLVSQGYDAYTEEIELQGKKTYRVKVGKAKTRPEAEGLAKKLASEGYPTRICP